ncbi:MAG TPA: YggT family protein [Sphingobium sp.]|nr:YggT family protein [Sphingobium sp.]
MATALIQIIILLLTVLWWIIIVQAIMSWLIAFNVINTSNDFVRSVIIALDRLTAPIYNPVRRFMPDLGALDLSPMVVLLAIVILRDIILRPMIGPV